jgi:inositol-hexakisphosphate/diphosphoinositol-pentakisphosphate 1-kinase
MLLKEAAHILPTVSDIVLKLHIAKTESNSGTP